MNRTIFFIGIVILFVFNSCKKEAVTLESLLGEMTDRTVLTQLPENPYTLKQFSSYDRKSVSPDDNNWWANADYTQFVREEKNEGRREFVLLDAAGPGAVVRFWMTFAGDGATDGILRFYIDNNETPEIVGNALEILSGEKITSEPLASSVSPETEYEHRGHNLYLPIPYSKNCKITIECDAIIIENNRRTPSIYYNICYRTYEPETLVESFSNEVLARAKSTINETSEILLSQQNIEGEILSEKEILKPDEELLIQMEEKGKAISKIKMKIDAENLNQALRSTVLSVSFDGQETVWVPAGDFFGTGYQVNTSQTWETKVSNDGTMESYWIMPFQKSAQIKAINYGNQEVTVLLEVVTSEYKWKKSSMYFGAAWHEFNRIHSAKDISLENHDWHFDVNYVDVKGQGVYVGDALTVFNTVDAWWGEGDEKIFVDGENFPSSIGTGTEDYYGYAWCRPEKFTHPFIAQPTGAGNFHPGMTVNMRFRDLDAIPFQNKISSNIELWHWVKTEINFATTAFWYAKPGFQINNESDIESVKIPVALKRSDIYKPEVDETGKIEGEYLDVVSVKSGIVETQSGNFGWSGENQLWWKDAKADDEMVCIFILRKTGKFQVSAQLTKAVDYGMVQFYLNGIAVGKIFNGYNEKGVITETINLGVQILSEGENIFTAKITGSDKKAKPGNMVGIDYLSFVAIN